MGQFGEIPASSTSELGIVKLLHLAHLQNYCGSTDSVGEAKEYGEGRVFDAPISLESGAELPNPGFFSPRKKFIDNGTLVVQDPTHTIPGGVEKMSLADAIIELDKNIGLAAGALAGMGLDITLGDPSSWPLPSEVEGLVASGLNAGVVVAGAGDLIEGILLLDSEIIKIDTWLGRNLGDTEPWAAPLNVVQAGDDIKQAIERLDDEFGDINSFIGRSAGQSAPVFTGTNYVSTDTNLEAAIITLDDELGTLSSSVGSAGSDISDIDSFIGRGAGQSAPNFTGTNYVSGDTELEAAIITLDDQLASVAGGSASSGDLAALQTQVTNLETFTGSGGAVAFYPAATTNFDLLDNAGASITTLAAAIDVLAEHLDLFMQDSGYTPP